MSRRVRCYLARAAWVVLIVGALIGMNFINVSSANGSTLLWADQHTTLLSLLLALLVLIIGVLTIAIGVALFLNWLWREAFGSECP